MKPPSILISSLLPLEAGQHVQHVELGDSVELPATDLKMVDWFYVCWFHPILYIHMVDAPVCISLTFVSCRLICSGCFRLHT